MTKAKNAVDLSRYSKEEREIIAIVERSQERPLLQWEIDLSLMQAWAIGNLEAEPKCLPATPFCVTNANPRFKPAKEATAFVIVGAKPAVKEE